MVRTERTVMVVDDDPSFLAAVVRLIRTGGYDARGFGTIAGLRSSLPFPENCCVLVDVMLRGESGLEIPDMLHAQEEPAAVVFMSATEDREKIETASGMCVVPCLKKPIEATTLFEALEAAFLSLRQPSQTNHQ